MPGISLNKSSRPRGNAVRATHYLPPCVSSSPMTPLATFLSASCSTSEVRHAGGGLFKRASEREMMTMLAMRSITPKCKANGEVAYWTMCAPVARVRFALKAQRGRLDAEANHTVQRGVAGFAHVMRICETYGHA